MAWPDRRPFHVAAEAIPGGLAAAEHPKRTAVAGLAAGGRRDRGRSAQSVRPSGAVQRRRASPRGPARVPHRPRRNRAAHYRRRADADRDASLSGRPAPYTQPVAELKPAYLVSGDDDAKIDAWRARVRRRAEDENGPGGLEAFDGRASGPDAVAAALTTLTFATGDRYLLADGVDAWKAGDLEPLERELAALPEGTVLVLIARGKPPARLAKAVAKAGGEQREYAA